MRVRSAVFVSAEAKCRELLLEKRPHFSTTQTSSYNLLLRNVAAAQQRKEEKRSSTRNGNNAVIIAKPSFLLKVGRDFEDLCSVPFLSVVAANCKFGIAPAFVCYKYHTDR